MLENSSKFCFSTNPMFIIVTLIKFYRFPFYLNLMINSNLKKAEEKKLVYNFHIQYSLHLQSIAFQPHERTSNITTENFSHNHNFRVYCFEKYQFIETTKQKWYWLYIIYTTDRTDGSLSHYNVVIIIITKQ